MIAPKGSPCGTHHSTSLSAAKATNAVQFMQRTEQHVEVLSKSRWSLVWWKSLHVLAVVGAVLVHRALLTNTPQRAPASSTSDAVLV